MTELSFVNDVEEFLPSTLSQSVDNIETRICHGPLVPVNISCDRTFEISRSDGNLVGFGNNNCDTEIAELTKLVRVTIAKGSSEVTVIDLAEVTESYGMSKVGDTAELIQATDITDVINVSEVNKLTEVHELTKATNVTEITNADEVTEHAGVTEVAELAEVTEEFQGVTEVTKVAEVSDLSKEPEVSKATETTEVGKVTEVTKLIKRTEITEAFDVTKSSDLAEVTKSAETIEIVKIAESKDLTSGIRMTAQGDSSIEHRDKRGRCTSNSQGSSSSRGSVYNSESSDNDNICNGIPDPEENHQLNGSRIDSIKDNSNSSNNYNNISNNNTYESGMNGRGRVKKNDEDDDGEEDDDDDSASKTSSGKDSVVADPVDPNQIEDRFRVDRRKLEQLILAIGNVAEKLNAEDFFSQVMRDTNTTIAWPSKLKIGARSKKDPFVKVFGTKESIVAARDKVLTILDTKSHRVTLKMEVSHTDHSHIIGKGGINIKDVMQNTDCHIHFPDSNRGSVLEKCNQVSIAGSAAAVEKARQRIRELQPLVILFEVPLATVSNGGLNPTDGCAAALQQIQHQHNVTVTMRQDRRLNARSVLVRGSVHAAAAVKQATASVIRLLMGYCEMAYAPVSLLMDIAPQHHSLVAGPAGSNVQQIMQRTDTTVHFPDLASVAPHRRNTIYVTGAIDNVLVARQQLLGYLPIVMLYDIQEDSTIDLRGLGQLMDRLSVNVNIKPKQKPPNKSVVIKTSERNVSNMYEARRLIAGGNNFATEPEGLTSAVKEVDRTLSTSSQLPHTSSSYQTVNIGGRVLMLPQGSVPPKYSSATILPVSIAQVPVYKPTPVIPRFQPRPNSYHLSPGGQDCAIPKANSFSGSGQELTTASHQQPSVLRTVTISQPATTTSAHTSTGITSSDMDVIYEILKKVEANNSLADKQLSASISDPTLTLPPLTTQDGFLSSSSFNCDKSMGSHVQPTVTPEEFWRRDSMEKSPRSDGLPIFQLASLSEQLLSLGLEPGYTDSHVASSTSPYGSLPNERDFTNMPSMESFLISPERLESHTGPSSPHMSQADKSPASSSSPSSSMGQHQLGQLGRAYLQDALEDDQKRFNATLISTSGVSPAQSKAPGFSRPMPDMNSILMASSSVQDFEYEQKKLLANRAIQDKPSGETRTPTDFWSGLGFSRSMPDAAIRARLGQHHLRQHRMGIQQGQQSDGEVAIAECGATGGHSEENESDEHGSPGGMWGSDAVHGSEHSAEGASLKSGVEYGRDESFSQLLNVMSNAPAFLPDNTTSVQENSKSHMDAFSHLSSIWRPICPSTTPSGGDDMMGSMNQNIDLAELLSQLGLGRYSDIFQQQEIDLPTFRTLSEQDLKELGISTFGARRKMLLAIADLNKKQSILAPPPGLPNPYSDGSGGVRMDFFSHSGRW